MYSDFHFQTLLKGESNTGVLKNTFFGGTPLVAASVDLRVTES